MTPASFRSFALLITLVASTDTARSRVHTQPAQQLDIAHSLLQVFTRSLQSEDTDTCYNTETTAATVTSILQLQAQQQLQNQTVQQGLLSGLSQYLRVPDCNIQLSFTASTACPVATTANSTYTCSDGNYICRGVTQVPLDVYNAVQNNQCTSDATGSTATCLGTSLDLTTYLSVQQGQCCLQCPGQSACTADASQSPLNSSLASTASYDCGNFTLSIAVGDSLDGSSLEDLLGVAVSGGLLDLYLQTSGLPDASTLSVGPTGKVKHASVLQQFTATTCY